MYVHLGQDVVIPVSEVVAIVDAAALQRRGLALPDLVAQAEARGRLTRLADGAGTSLVITRERVYLSPISPLTLRRRAAAPWAMDGAAGTGKASSTAKARRLRKGARRAL